MGQYDTLTKEDREYIIGTWLNPEFPRSYRQFKTKMDERSIEIDIAHSYRKHEQFKREALVMGICVGFMGFVGGVFYNVVQEPIDNIPRLEYRSTQEHRTSIDTITSQTEIKNK